MAKGESEGKRPLSDLQVGRSSEVRSCDAREAAVRRSGHRLEDSPDRLSTWLVTVNASRSLP